MNYTDIGQSYASAYDLLQKHEQFHKNCFVIRNLYLIKSNKINQYTRFLFKT